MKEKQEAFLRPGRNADLIYILSAEKNDYITSISVESLKIISDTNSAPGVVFRIPEQFGLKMTIG